MEIGVSRIGNFNETDRWTDRQTNSHFAAQSSVGDRSSMKPQYHV